MVTGESQARLQKNTLVYYLKTKLEKGKGRKTNWIMHEYVLNETPPPNSEAFARGNKVRIRVYPLNFKVTYFGFNFLKSSSR